MLFRPLLLAMGLITCTYCFSQQTGKKQKLFDKFPEKVQITESVLKSTLSANVGQQLNIDLGSDFIFRGTVSSNLKQLDNLQTVVIKVENFSNSTFAVSKIINKDGSSSFVGRILNLTANDGYEIRRDNGGSYFLQKIETDKILQTCKFVD